MSVSEKTEALINKKEAQRRQGHEGFRETALIFSDLWQYHNNIITLIHAVLLCLCMGGVHMWQFNFALLIGKQTS